jgi:UDP-glucose 4-epimerase
MKKNILIIGSTGFIGRNVVEQLLNNQYNIILLIKNHSHIPNIFQNHKSISIIKTNLKDMVGIKKAIAFHDINIVLHLASNLIPSSTHKEFNMELENLILPTYTLLEYLSERCIKIIFFSSGGTVYGDIKEKAIKENHALAPINHYGYSKLMIEDYIQFLGRTKNLPFIILRPSNVYGRYQRLEAMQGFIAVAIGKTLSNLPIEIWGDGETVRDYIDVEDLAFLTNEIIDSDINNKIINLGSGEGNSLNQIIKYLEATLGKKIEVNYKNSRKIDVNRMVLDIGKIKSYFDYKPKSIQKGIKDFLTLLDLKIK